PGLGGECEGRTERGVLSIPGGVEHRERIGSTVEKDGDENRVGRSGRTGDPLLEEPERELARAVDRQRKACRPGQEGATAETAAGRKRHAFLDYRQAAPCFGHRTAED